MRRPLTDKDGEVRELTAEDMRLFKPIAEVDPGMVEAMKEFRRQLGRPRTQSPKVHIGFRLASDVVASIKASGRGYNARVEQALRAAGFGEKIKRKSPSKTTKIASAANKRRPQRQGTKPAAGTRRA
jgi:uncharacterized protein (DUF4415 family)